MCVLWAAVQPLVSPVFLQSAPAESYEKSGRVKGVDVHPYRPWVLSVDEVRAGVWGVRGSARGRARRRARRRGR